MDFDIKEEKFFEKKTYFTHILSGQNLHQKITVEKDEV